MDASIGPSAGRRGPRRNEQSFRHSLFLGNQCVKSLGEVGGSSVSNPRVEAECCGDVAVAEVRLDVLYRGARVDEQRRAGGSQVVWGDVE